MKMTQEMDQKVDRDQSPESRPRHRRDPGLPRRQRVVLREGRSTSSWTSACSRTSRRTPCRGSPSTSSRRSPDCASTPARAGDAAASSSGCTRAPGSGHVAEHVALALQQVVGHDIRRGKTRQVKGATGRYNIIYGYVDEQVGLAAGRLAVRLVNHLVEADPEFDFAEELDAFILRAQRTAFGPSTQAIIDEAVSRDIPWIRLNQASLVQLGQGVHAKRIRATMTSETSSIAVDIASDKEPHHPAARGGGAPGSQAGVGAYGGPGGHGRRSDRLPGRGQATGRQPRPRGVPEPDGPRGGARVLRDRAGPVAPRHGRGRVVRDRQGLPLPDHRRQGRRHRRAGARERDR